MNTKRLIGWSSLVVILILVISTLTAAMGVAGEASQLKELLEKAVSQKTPIAELQPQLVAKGYDFTTTTPTLDGKGRIYSLGIYRTWLTVHVDSNAEGKASGYHMDRAEAWF